jgi:hypothetical protein
LQWLRTCPRCRVTEKSHIFNNNHTSCWKPRIEPGPPAWQAAAQAAQPSTTCHSHALSTKFFFVKCPCWQISFWPNVFLGKRGLLGKCPSGQMSFWANMLLGKRFLGQMSVRANVFLGKYLMGKCLSGQISYGQTSYGQISILARENIFPGKRLIGKCIMGKCRITLYGHCFSVSSKCFATE